MLRVRKRPGEPSAAAGSIAVSFCAQVLRGKRLPLHQAAGRQGGGPFARGRSLTLIATLVHWWTLDFIASAMHLAQASPLDVHTSSSVFYFLATPPRFKKTFF